MNETEIVEKVWAVAMPYLAYIGAARLLLKPIAAKLCAGVERAILKSKETQSTEDDKIVKGMLSSKAYLWTAWVLDYLVSVKLPMNGKQKK